MPNLSMRVIPDNASIRRMHTVDLRPNSSTVLVNNVHMLTSGYIFQVQPLGRTCLELTNLIPGLQQRIPWNLQAALTQHPAHSLGTMMHR
jgi:hypothetical protein